MALSPISRTIWLLGAASFFNDLSSEMIYPMMPLFLSAVLGAGTIHLGLIEGLAESTAAFLKVLSGVWTDRLRHRKPFIHLGYLLAGISRSLIGTAQSWPMVLGLRFFDRLGKGVRTSPRDALIADVTPQEHHGRAYGLHRSMDHAGAVVGPLIAAALLSWGNFSIREVFLAAAVPALCVMIFLFILNKEKSPRVPAVVEHEKQAASDLPLPREFKLFLGAVFLFELGGSTDAFLLLRLADAGISPQSIAILWSILHLIKMITTYLLGPLADHMNRQRLLMSGWILYTLIYFCIGWVFDARIVVGLFLLYGLYAGLTEPTERALISQWATAHNRGKLFGYYHGTVGFAALPAGLLFGFFWSSWGVNTAFYMAAALSGLACLILAGIPTLTRRLP